MSGALNLLLTGEWGYHEVRHYGSVQVVWIRMGYMLVVCKSLVLYMPGPAIQWLVPYSVTSVIGLKSTLAIFESWILAMKVLLNASFREVQKTFPMWSSRMTIATVHGRLVSLCI